MVKLLEELAANAWPPAVSQLLDGWLLRHASGISRRANSVLALSGDTQGFAERLLVAEEFYRRRGQPARFRLSPAVSPADLDQRLAERGYRVEAPTWVLDAGLEQLLSRSTGDSRFRVTLLDAPDDHWFKIYHEGSSHPARERTVREGIMTRIGPRTAFALLHVADRPIAVGQAVVERGWLGLFSMATHPSFRRQGAATAVIRALADWARTQGAERAYLEVMQTSMAALSLYYRLGFQPHYQYHYREQPADNS